jgi:hypothetical protein
MTSHLSPDTHTPRITPWAAFSEKVLALGNPSVTLEARLAVHLDNYERYTVSAGWKAAPRGGVLSDFEKKGGLGPVRPRGHALIACQWRSNFRPLWRRDFRPLLPALKA